jgi:hypothetical protein
MKLALNVKVVAKLLREHKILLFAGLRKDDEGAAVVENQIQSLMHH